MQHLERGRGVAVPPRDAMALPLSAACRLEYCAFPPERRWEVWSCLPVDQAEIPMRRIDACPKMQQQARPPGVGVSDVLENASKSIPPELCSVDTAVFSLLILRAHVWAEIGLWRTRLWHKQRDHHTQFIGPGM